MLRLPILCLVLAPSLYGQSARLSAPDQNMNPGQVMVVSLSLASAGQAIAALQFDMDWDQPLGLQMTAGDQVRAASKIPYAASAAPPTVRWLVAGVNQTAIADGELLKVFLSVDPATSAGSAQIRIRNLVAADPAGANVPLTADPINVQIQRGTAVQLPASAVLNAASLSPGPLSPGEIITLFGFNAIPPVSLRIDGAPAPILYAGASQVNAIVPFGLDLTSPARLEIASQTQRLTATLPVAAAAPSIFTLNGAGLGPGAILNQDYTPNSFDRPASAGSIVMIYGTGFGLLQSPVTDGQVSIDANQTTLPVTATVSGLPAEVLYAGAAPGLIAGATQVNVRLPASLRNNLIAPLVLSVPGSSTVTGVTVAIR